MSIDRAKSWTRLKANLPTVRIDEITLHPRDNAMILATHGRALWILDHLEPIQEYASAQAVATDARLFTPPPYAMFRRPARDRNYEFWGDQTFYGENPPPAAVISWLNKKQVGDVKLKITDAAGREIREIAAPVLANSNKAGMQSACWDLRVQPNPAPPPAPGRGGRGGREGQTGAEGARGAEGAGGTGAETPAQSPFGAGCGVPAGQGGGGGLGGGGALSQPREQAAEVWRQLKVGESWTGEFWMKRRTGVSFPVAFQSAELHGVEVKLEILDVAGRRVSTRTVSGAGVRTLEIAAGVRLPVGVYLIRVAQGGRHASARVSVVR